MRCDFDCPTRPVWQVVGSFRGRRGRVDGTALVCDRHRDEAVAELSDFGPASIELLAMRENVGGIEVFESWLDLMEEVIPHGS